MRQTDSNPTKKQIIAEGYDGSSMEQENIAPGGVRQLASKLINVYLYSDKNVILNFEIYKRLILEIKQDLKKNHKNTYSKSLFKRRASPISGQVSHETKQNDYIHTLTKNY